MESKLRVEFDIIKSRQIRKLAMDLGISPTEFVNKIWETLDFEVKEEIEKTKIILNKNRLKVKHSPGKNFVTDY